MKSICFWALFVSLVLGSCNSDSGSTEAPPSQTESATSLPLLNGTNGIGMIRGFNPSNPTVTIDSMETRWQEALNAGMRVGRLQIDWPELEPETDMFDTRVLENQLALLRNDGLQPFLLISAYDSEGPVLPGDLMGLPLDDTNVISRFKNLMDKVIPLLANNEGYLISISNEADANFAENPTLSSELLNFLREIKTHIHTLNPEMAVTVTFAEGSLDLDAEKAEEIIAACDVACFNFYGAGNTATPPFVRTLSPEEIQSDIQRMLRVSGSKNLVIQELGMHTDEPLLDSSTEIQRRFFEVFFTEMQQEERIKAAYVFQLVDWSTAATDVFRGDFEGDPTAEAFFESFATSLQTLGLIAFDNGERRPAWGEFIKWLGIFATN